MYGWQSCNEGMHVVLNFCAARAPCRLTSYLRWERGPLLAQPVQAPCAHVGIGRKRGVGDHLKA